MPSIVCSGIQAVEAREHRPVNPLPEQPLIDAQRWARMPDGVCSRMPENPHAGGIRRFPLGFPSGLLARPEGGAEGAHHAVFGGLVGNAKLPADVCGAARHHSIPGFLMRQGHAADILTCAAESPETRLYFTASSRCRSGLSLIAGLDWSAGPWRAERIAHVWSA